MSDGPISTIKAAPKRIQLRRTKGWRKPEGVVVVSRPSRWGNQFKVGDPHPVHGRPMSRNEAVALFEHVLVSYTHRSKDPISDFMVSEAMIREIQRELRGKDLACWCSLDVWCHGDVLLRLANGPLIEI